MKQITICTESLNKVCCFELEKGLECIQEANRIIKSQVPPYSFKYSEDLRMLSKRLDSFSEECEEYRDIIKKAVLGFEQLSAETVKKIEKIEKVELGKFINR